MSKVTIIRPKKVFSLEDLKEVWRYKELLYFFTWRDFKVRYKQTVLGAAWAILQPVLTMVVFSVFFGFLARVPSDGLPYPVFAYTALLPWALFAHALAESANSLVNNPTLVTKVYDQDRFAGDLVKDLARLGDGSYRRFICYMTSGRKLVFAAATPPTLRI